MTMTLKTLTAIVALACGSLHAQSIDVRDAWVRATVQGQRATGAFMKITARDGARLVAVSSPAVGVAEVHEMTMDGNVMKMRAVRDGLEMPAGKTVELKPGGYHIMLMDLKTALPKDITMPLTLVFKDAKGVQTRVELKVRVATAAPAVRAGDLPAADSTQHKH